MQYRINKIRSYRAMTLVEILIAMAIMAIVFSAVVPQFRSIQNSWDSKQANSEILQNGRVLIDFLNQNLSKAARITAVSGPAQTNGYIEFESNDASNLRFDINATSNYVEFGPVGSLSDLAGPVSQLLFTCYDSNDFGTPITDVNEIRFIKVQTILSNPAANGQDKTFTTYTYLRTSPDTDGEGLVGWWKLDETSGKDAEDSSGIGNDGRLKNMIGDEWTTGNVGGCLEFDGDNDYVDCGDDESLEVDDAITLSAWVWHNAFITGQVERYVTVRSEIAVIRKESDERLHFYIKTDGTLKHLRADSVLTEGYWYHVAGTWDGTTQRLYLDGVEIDSQTPGGVLDNTFVGINLSSSTESFRGLLDDVRIYNRALSGEEIACLANVLTYKELTETKAGTDVTSITIQTPSGTREDDLLIAAVAVDWNTSGSMVPPTGKGWTRISLNDYSSKVTLGVWWKLAEASESPSHEFTWSGAQQAYGWMMRFMGSDLTDPINVWTGNGESSTNPTSPSVTTSVDDCLILRLGGFDDSNITVDDPGLSGHTAITMDSSGGGGSGHVGWWKLDETSGLTAADSSGYGNNGTLTNMSGNEWTTGQIGGAIAFDGTDDYIDCGNDDSLNITDEITMSAWINMTSRPANNDWVFIHWKDYVYGLYLTGQTDSETVLSAYFNLDTGYIDTWEDADILLPLNSWVHVAVTFDGTDAKGYVNGELDFTTNKAGSIDTTTNPFTIGDSDNDYYEGLVDEARVYDLALDGDEITALYNGNEPGSSGDTVSGGAGYVKQSASGSSGLSSFSLTASQESRMVTIAIAPNPDGGSGGGIAP